MGTANWPVGKDSAKADLGSLHIPPVKTGGNSKNLIMDIASGRWDTDHRDPKVGVPTDLSQLKLEAIQEVSLPGAGSRFNSKTFHPPTKVFDPY
jgi:hypothetical protein